MGSVALQPCGPLHWTPHREVRAGEGLKGCRSACGCPDCWDGLILLRQVLLGEDLWGSESLPGYSGLSHPCVRRQEGVSYFCSLMQPCPGHWQVPGGPLRALITPSHLHAPSSLLRGLRVP